MTTEELKDLILVKKRESKIVFHSIGGLMEALKRINKEDQS